MLTTINQKPSQRVTSAGPLRISCPLGLEESQSNHSNNSNIEQRIPRSLAPSPSPSIISVPAMKRALEIPEIVLLIQEQLDRPSLLISLRIASLWHQVGQHLVWQTINWENATSNNFAVASANADARTIEGMMVENSHRIRTLRCMFHSQAGTSFVDSSVLLRTMLTATTGGGGREEGGNRARTRNLRTLSLRGHFSLQSIGYRDDSSADTATTTPLPLPSAPRYIPFHIPTLAHLDIRPSVNSAVDLHLILDTAIGLRTLVVDSHGSFVDSSSYLYTFQSTPLDSEAIIPKHHIYPAHESLVSLKIQHLKMSRQELEGVAARCPNLVEFQSLCSPATLWRPSPGSQPPHQHQHQQQHQQDMEFLHTTQQQQEQEDLNNSKSLVGTLAKYCPKIQRFHVGLQQGGFHTDLVRDALTCFPSLVSFGLPTTDCTKATMDVIKASQLPYRPSTTTTSPPGSWKCGMRELPAMRGGSFLTSLTIMNVSSSEKVSQALHEFLCWTPYLKEFYAYNTTLYLEHMQSPTGEVVEMQEPLPVVVAPQPVATAPDQQDQYLPRRRSSSSSSGSSGGCGRIELADVYIRVSEHESGSEEGVLDSRTGVTVSNPSLVHTLVTPPTVTPSSSGLSSTPVATPIGSTSCGQQHSQQQQQRWACSGLETLVVRFAHLPWRNNTQPPKRSKDSFAFLTGLQKLKRLCIKEGLMLEAGREYDSLAQLQGLEEVVFTTCYPIPIKPSDLDWVAAVSPLSSSSLLKKVVVRRQKANTVLDREMIRWFEEREREGCRVKLSLQLTDCCEEEYRFP
ncbi:hypothetical protein BKA57DRAFT_472722 [Linnemannia elongata]|nr:hypothetical protein BKA57DRAFT_472722 [Linnemannia elongata]